LKSLKNLVIFAGLAWSATTIAEPKAGLFLQAGLLYYTQSARTPSTTGTTVTRSRATTNFNTLAGYSLGNGLALGIKYYNETSQDGWKFSDSASPPESKTSALGPAVGVQLGNFAAFGSYLVIQAPENVVASQKFDGGGGYILDFMYLINMGGWSFGPQISMIDFQYKKSTVNGVETTIDPPTVEDYLYPYFSFFVQL
jgi:hypothetical protein